MLTFSHKRYFVFGGEVVSGLGERSYTLLPMITTKNNYPSASEILQGLIDSVAVMNRNLVPQACNATLVLMHEFDCQEDFESFINKKAEEILPED